MKDARLVALIEPKQLKLLKRAAKRGKITMGEAVRQAIAKYLKGAK
jgi:hypothetical protein